MSSVMAIIGAILLALLGYAIAAGLVALWVGFWVWVTPWSWMEVSVFMILLSAGHASYNTSNLR